MAYLVLDLDETTFVISSDKENINAAHTLSSRTLTGRTVYGDESKIHDLYLINPEELSNLIEEACLHYDGVIILTAGYWHREILEEIEEYLDLTPEASTKFKSSCFYSPSTDAVFWSLPSEMIRSMDKNIRLQKIIKIDPDLTGKHFVILDDNLMHHRSCAKNPRIIPVLATTDTPEKEFYRQASEALALAQEKENQLKSDRVEHRNKRIQLQSKVSITEVSGLTRGSSLFEDRFFFSVKSEDLCKSKLQSSTINFTKS